MKQDLSKGMWYGRSLSLCMIPLMHGDITISKIACIISGTSVKTNADIMSLVILYHETYWSEFSIEVCYNTLKDLFTFNKIIQPRLLDNRLQQSVRDGIWCETFAEAWGSVELKLF